jgi:AraC-like DNA-binding protein
MTLKTPRDYAAKMNITPNYLNALCRKKSGKSAGELIRQRILLEAKRLLAHSTMSISEIAFQLGFEDNSYFGRYFRRYTRLTPGEFRQQQLPR